MFDRIMMRKATLYDVLTTWLKTKLENDEYIQEKDLRVLLHSLDIDIRSDD